MTHAGADPLAGPSAPPLAPARALGPVLVSVAMAGLIGGATLGFGLPLTLLWAAGALIAGRFATHERTPRAALVGAAAAGSLLWIFALLLLRPLEAMALGAAPFHGAGIALGRRPMAGPARAAYRGAALYFAALLALSLLTPAFLAAAGHPERGYLAREVRPVWDASRAAFTAAIDALVGADPARRAELETQRDAILAFLDAEDPSLLLVSHLVLHLLATTLLGVALLRGRRLILELAHFRASELEMILVIVALLFRLAAPRVGEGELLALARPMWWGVATLLWLQAVGLMAHLARLGRLSGQKALYFVGGLGVCSFVLMPLAGFLIGLADVYLDFRNPRDRPGAS